MAADGQATGLVVTDPVVGELLTLADASTDRLGAFFHNLREFRTRLAAWEEMAGAEVIRRMDADGSWTVRVRLDDTLELELKAPSPDAGTDDYDESVLEQELARLVEAGAITDRLLEEAVPRSVTIKCKGRDTARIERFAKAQGHEVSASTTVAKRGIDKLRKLRNPDVDAALEKAHSTRTPPRRVTAKEHVKR